MAAVVGEMQGPVSGVLQIVDCQLTGVFSWCFTNCILLVEFLGRLRKRFRVGESLMLPCAGSAGVSQKHKGLRWMQEQLDNPEGASFCAF